MPQEPERRQSVWGVARGVLGFSADLGGFLGLVLVIVPVAAAIGSLLAGYGPIAALSLIVVTSVGLNVFMAYRLLIAGERIDRIRVAMEAAVNQAASSASVTVLQAAPPASVTVRRAASSALAVIDLSAGWLRDPEDFGTLAEITEAQFDEAFRRVETVAQDLLGEDAVIVFDGFYAQVRPGGFGSFRVEGHSQIGEKGGTFLMRRPDSQPSVASLRREATSQIGNPVPRPWRVDYSWKDLVRRVWEKERPCRGDFWLYFSGIVGPGWHLRVSQVRDGVSEPTKSYVLRGTDLIVTSGAIS